MAGQPPGATRSAKPGEIDARWYVVDAADLVLGRLATQLASRLRGKHRALYTPHVDTGDFLIVVNAEKVRLTGRKAEQKVYYRHSGWVGALRSTTAGKILAGDVPGTDYCIGFSTCVTRTIELANSLRTVAGSHERLMVLEVFGRYAGFTAMLPTMAGAAHRSVIPEYKFKIERLAELMINDRS